MQSALGKETPARKGILILEGSLNQIREVQMHRFVKQNVKGTKGSSSDVPLNAIHERSEVSFTSRKGDIKMTTKNQKGASRGPSP